MRRALLPHQEIVGTTGTGAGGRARMDKKLVTKQSMKKTNDNWPSNGGRGLYTGLVSRLDLTWDSESMNHRDAALGQSRRPQQQQCRRHRLRDRARDRQVIIIPKLPHLDKAHTEVGGSGGGGGRSWHCRECAESNACNRHGIKEFDGGVVDVVCDVDSWSAASSTDSGEVIFQPRELHRNFRVRPVNDLESMDDCDAGSIDEAREEPPQPQLRISSASEERQQQQQQQQQKNQESLCTSSSNCCSGRRRQADKVSPESSCNLVCGTEILCRPGSLLGINIEGLAVRRLPCSHIDNTNEADGKGKDVAQRRGSDCSSGRHSKKHVSFSACVNREDNSESYPSSPLSQTDTDTSAMAQIKAVRRDKMKSIKQQELPPPLPPHATALTVRRRNMALTNPSLEKSKFRTLSCVTVTSADNDSTGALASSCTISADLAIVPPPASSALDSQSRHYSYVNGNIASEMELASGGILTHGASHLAYLSSTDSSDTNSDPGKVGKVVPSKEIDTKGQGESQASNTATATGKLAHTKHHHGSGGNCANSSSDQHWQQLLHMQRHRNPITRGEMQLQSSLRCDVTSSRHKSFNARHREKSAAGSGRRVTFNELNTSEGRLTKLAAMTAPVRALVGSAPTAVRDSATAVVYSVANCLASTSGGAAGQPPLVSSESSESDSNQPLLMFEAVGCGHPDNDRSSGCRISCLSCSSPTQPHQPLPQTPEKSSTKKTAGLEASQEPTVADSLLRGLVSNAKSLRSTLVAALALLRDRRDCSAALARAVGAATSLEELLRQVQGGHSRRRRRRPKSKATAGGGKGDDSQRRWLNAIDTDVTGTPASWDAEVDEEGELVAGVRGNRWSSVSVSSRLSAAAPVSKLQCHALAQYLIGEDFVVPSLEQMPYLEYRPATIHVMRSESRPVGRSAEVQMWCRK